MNIAPSTMQYFGFLLLFVLIQCVIYERVSSVKKNACPKLKDYVTVDWNPNCWFDPDADVRYNVKQLILNNGFRSEEHRVTTEDGYVLTMYRIINEKLKKDAKDKQPIFLQHGLSGSCISFLGIGNKSLAYLLSDAGYDVWLGNSRGNIYSTEHLNYSSKTDYRYWNFSFHEMGVYDLPTSLRYVKKNANDKKIIFVGVSLGTTMSLVYNSIFPEEAAETVKLNVYFGPVAGSAQGRGINYSIVGPGLKRIVKMLPKGTVDFLINKFDPEHGQQEIPFLPLYLNIRLVGLFLRFFDTLDMYNVQPEIMPKIVRQTSSGASVKTYVHIFNSVGSFRMFDYGTEKNLEIYGTEIPPKYNLSRIKVPILAYYSVGDRLNTPEDMAMLLQMLPDEVKYGIHKVDDDKFTHMEYMYNENVKQLIYDPMMNILQKM